MANDRTIKNCDCYPVTRDTITNSHNLPWYQGSYYADRVKPQKITAPMANRVVAACEGLFDRNCLTGFGTILGVPFVTICPHGQQFPRLVLVFQENETQLRKNDQLLGFRFNEPLLASWPAYCPDLADRVAETVIRLLSS